MSQFIERAMHITTINRVFPHFVRLQSKIYHQTMHHPPTAFAVLFVTSTCFSGIILFSLLAFTEFFNRRVPEYERIFFDQILVTRKCKASTRTEESECAICLGAFGKSNLMDTVFQSSVWCSFHSPMSFQNKPIGYRNQQVACTSSILHVTNSG